MLILSPDCAPTGTVTITPSVVALPSSAALTKPSLLTSVTRLTRGWPSASERTVALSVALLLVLPATSRRLAVTVNSVLAPEVLKLWLTLPALMSAALRVMSVSGLLLARRISTSPTAAPAGRVLVTRTRLPVALSSLTLMKASLLPSLAMLTVRPARSLRSNSAVSVAVLPLTPSWLVSQAWTSSVAPLAGAAKPVSTPLAIWLAVSVKLRVVVPSVTVSTSPATLPAGTVTLTPTSPTSSLRLT